MARYFIFSHLNGRNKLTDKRWIYRLTNGKIYPLATSHNSFKQTTKINALWKLLLRSTEFQNKLSIVFQEKIFIDTTEINNIYKTYKPYLIKFYDNLNMSQRELNYKLTKDYNVLFHNIKFLSDFKKDFKDKRKENNDTQPKLALGSIQELRSVFNFYLHNNTVTIRKGKYQIDNNIILPNGIDLRIEAGTIINLGDSISLIVNGRIFVEGTASEKVIIQSVSETPFGVFGAIGNGKDTSHITHLSISNGSEAHIDGKYLSGALSCYHQNIKINNLICFENKADDGLNIKYGNISIVQCSFKDNWADQVDLDFCEGRVINCNFNYSNGDINGDGLDLSGCEISLTNSHFDNFSDKALSVGEKSNISVSKCSFENSNIAISIKDLSFVEAQNNTFTNNNTVFNLFMKKEIFGGGVLKIGENVYRSNQNYIVQDKMSQVIGF